MYTRKTSLRTKRLLRGLAVTRKVLWALGETALVAGALIVPGRARDALIHGGLDAFSVLRDDLEEADIRRAFRDLHRRKYVMLRKRAKLLEAVLTKKGAVAAAMEAVRLSERKPNGGYCVVTFDFPEKARSQRAGFRRMLRDLGFEMLHLSVWVSERDVNAALISLLKIMDLGEWVRVFESHLIYGPSHDALICRGRDR